MKKLSTIFAAIAMATAAQAQNFAGTLTVAPLWKATETNGAALSTIELGTILSQVHTYGTNANQMNAISLVSGTLTNGQSIDFDLSAMTNAFGAVAFARVNFLAVRSPTNNAWIGTGTNATMTGTNALIVGGAASDQFAAWLGDPADTVVIRPGGLLLLTSPISGYVSTGKLFRIANVGGTNSITYELYLAGQQ